MHRDDAVDTVARLTEVARNSYTAAFRSHTGRWEPLPEHGWRAWPVSSSVAGLGSLDEFASPLDDPGRVRAEVLHALGAE
jgi:hypothetical protein